MTKILLAGLGLAFVMLSACATDPETGKRTIDVDASQAIRAAYLGQLQAWNAAGIDPIQLKGNELLYAATICGTLSAVGSLWRPDSPELTAEGGAWCAALVQTLAPAAPVTSPAPPPAPL